MPLSSPDRLELAPGSNAHLNGVHGRPLSSEGGQDWFLFLLARRRVLRRFNGRWFRTGTWVASVCGGSYDVFLRALVSTHARPHHLLSGSIERRVRHMLHSPALDVLQVLVNLLFDEFCMQSLLPVVFTR